MGLTVRQLAEMAGVSIATVSRALRNEPYVRPEVRERIIDLAERFHYRPNRLAQGIYSGKSNTVGILVPDVSHPGVSQLLRGALQCAYGVSSYVFIQETNAELEQSMLAIRRMIEQRVEGILLLHGSPGPLPRKLVMELKGHGTVLVGLGMHFFVDDVPFHAVQSDEEVIASIGLDYLVELGHRDIAYVGPVAPELEGDRGETIMRALRARGLTTEYFLPTVEAIHFTRDLADAVVETQFDQPVPPTAIFTWSDSMAALLIQSMTNHGLRVPQDISILGCANLPIAELATPPITTIDQHLEQIGYTAASLLFETIDIRETMDDVALQTVYVPVELIKRKSCALPRR